MALAPCKWLEGVSPLLPSVSLCEDPVSSHIRPRPSIQGSILKAQIRPFPDNEPLSTLILNFLCSKTMGKQVSVVYKLSSVRHFVRAAQMHEYSVSIYCGFTVMQYSTDYAYVHF